MFRFWGKPGSLWFLEMVTWIYHSFYAFQFPLDKQNPSDVCTIVWTDGFGGSHGDSYSQPHQVVCFTDAKNGISGNNMGLSILVIPQNGWCPVESTIKLDDLGVPLFQETSICSRHCMLSMAWFEHFCEENKNRISKGWSWIPFRKCSVQGEHRPILRHIHVSLRSDFKSTPLVFIGKGSQTLIQEVNGNTTLYG